MRQPPTDVSDSDVLRTVRAHWDDAVDAVEHLPLGFGAHHWRASAGVAPRWFVTLDRTIAGDEQRFEDAYGAARHLAAHGMRFVVACALDRDRALTVPCGPGVLSVAPWLDGRSGDGGFAGDGDLDDTVAILALLHAQPAPPTLRSWAPSVDGSFLPALEARVRAPWTRGPHGEDAHRLVIDRLEAVRSWTREHAALADLATASSSRWVVTHGEPHTRNHLVTRARRYLVDWESALLAPAERDLRTVLAGGADVPHDARMLRLFELDWRLDEVEQYSRWFAGPHGDGEDDRIAFEGLREELAGD